MYRKQLIEYLNSSNPDTKLKNRYTAFVRSLTNMIRFSNSYSDIISYIRAISQFELIIGDVEYHHNPLSLFSIVETEIKYLYKNNMINESDYGYLEFLISKNVMDHHYNGIIGLVPLPPVVHLYVEKNNLLIPKDFTIGNVTPYYEARNKYMTPHTLGKLQSYINNYINVDDETNSKLNNEFINLFKVEFLDTDNDSVLLPNIIDSIKNKKIILKSP